MSSTWHRRRAFAGRRVSFPTTLALVTVACLASSGPVTARGDVAADTSPTGASSVGLQLVLSGYERPLAIAAPRGDARMFIVEQTGKIRIATKVGSSWQKSGTFLDLTSSVACCDERGLLGLAFSPNYRYNGLFYVNYTRASDGATVVAEYRRASRDRADPSSKRLVLLIQQPFENHNGGTMVFGPDRRLYIGSGDGGSGGDPGNRAQRLDTLLGKILRIDPRDPDGGGPRTYGIPKDNPFVGVAGLDEIWSFGLRNPWKFSFDPATGFLWLADVGQQRWEELNRVSTGRRTNFGWRLLEGFHNFGRASSGARCTSDCKMLPIAAYPQDVAGTDDNCSVTGGHVYRGGRYPSLVGDYIFGDFCSGRIWRIPASFARGAPLPPATNTNLSISSFGEDSAREVYAVDLGGSIYRVTP